MTTPRTRFAGPVLEAADPIALARFYELLMGWEVVAREDDWVKIADPERTVKFEFQGDASYRPPVWPPADGEQQMMMHLDIGVDDLDRGVAFAMELGATVSDYQPQTGVCVMLDPAGHPFCLFPDPGV